MKMKELAIIIPHFNGKDILYQCIKSLNESDYQNFNVYVVDNGSTDDSVEYTISKFPQTKILRSEINRGYAGGCNFGYEQTSEPYIWFLNNDTEQEKDCLTFLMNYMKKNSNVSAVQPKLRSFYNKEKFDYSGACGGEIDYLGYPFARGRLFDHIEDDRGQYDHTDETIFWASGTAFLTRRDVLDSIGAFDEHFFAHMEEIDLSWRMQRAGWKISVVPEAILFHYSGFTLSAMNEKKMYLNHRNNLLMLYKNLDPNKSKKIMTIRLILEFVTVLHSLFTLDVKRLKAVLRAFKDYQKMKYLYISYHQKFNLPYLNHSYFYKHSIVKQYFIRQVKKYSDLT
jgi:GT2 family glycosyltransferase